MTPYTKLQQIKDLLLIPYEKIEFYFADKFLRKTWSGAVPEKHKDGSKIYWGDWILEMWQKSNKYDNTNK